MDTRNRPYLFSCIMVFRECCVQNKKHKIYDKIAQKPQNNVIFVDITKKMLYNKRVFIGTEIF